MKTTIIIPARYASTRLPGKPLAMIAGKSMLERVCNIAKTASQEFSNVNYYVAVDDEKVAKLCEEIGAPYIMTDPACPSGSDRTFNAVQQIPEAERPDFIINFQGDTPLTPPWFIQAMIAEFEKNSELDVVSPYIKMTWAELDKLREHKLETPFSGTTVTIDKNSDAFWFSKNIIPAIRGEEKLRISANKTEKGVSPADGTSPANGTSPARGTSPTSRHVGMYGYSYSALEKFVNSEVSYYEDLEGLEQLRFLENSMKIRMVEVDYQGRHNMSGVDAPQDIIRAEEIIQLDGEF